MGARNISSSRKASPADPISIDVVLVSLRERRLEVVAELSKRRGVLPWGTPARGEHLDAAATRIMRKAAGLVPGWIEQAGAFSHGTGHPAGALLSVCYVAVIPWVAVPAPWSWMPAHPPLDLPERQRKMLSAALGAVRHRMEHAPVAFSMLPRDFTLSELQLTYETILARRLHKASFRRALQAAFVVEPTGEWRGEGRGRPAQLYRYAPRRRKGTRRGVRLDLL